MTLRAIVAELREGDSISFVVPGLEEHVTVTLDAKTGRRARLVFEMARSDVVHTLKTTPLPSPIEPFGNGVLPLNGALIAAVA